MNKEREEQIKGMLKNRRIEKEYLKEANEEILRDLPDLEPAIDNMSHIACYKCGNRLTVSEEEENTDTCEDCLYDDTSGLSDLMDDIPEDEEEFFESRGC